jgi:hypothetical protein
MLTVGLQTSLMQQTWHSQWSKIVSPSDVFLSLGRSVSLMGPDQVNRQDVQHFRVQISELPVRDGSHV